MKTSLKRSEIIEQLKRILSLKSLRLVRQSIIDGGLFCTIYVLLIEHDGIFQVVNLSLRYGWIQVEICDSFSSVPDAILAHSKELEVQIGVFQYMLEEFYRDNNKCK